MRISDWSSDVCSSDLTDVQRGLADGLVADHRHQHDRHVAVQQRAAEAARELQAVDDRHAVVEQQQVGPVVLAPAKRILRIAEVEHVQLGADFLQDMAQTGTAWKSVVWGKSVSVRVNTL